MKLPSPVPKATGVKVLIVVFLALAGRPANGDKQSEEDGMLFKQSAMIDENWIKDLPPELQPKMSATNEAERQLLRDIVNNRDTSAAKAAYDKAMQEERAQLATVMKAGGPSDLYSKYVHVRSGIPHDRLTKDPEFKSFFSSPSESLKAYMAIKQTEMEGLDEIKNGGRKPENAAPKEDKKPTNPTNQQQGVPPKEAPKEDKKPTNPTNQQQGVPPKEARKEDQKPTNPTNQQQGVPPKEAPKEDQKPTNPTNQQQGVPPKKAPKVKNPTNPTNQQQGVPLNEPKTQDDYGPERLDFNEPEAPDGFDQPDTGYIEPFDPDAKDPDDPETQGEDGPDSGLDYWLGKPSVKELDNEKLESEFNDIKKRRISLEEKLEKRSNLLKRQDKEAEERDRKVFDLEKNREDKDLMEKSVEERQNMDIVDLMERNMDKGSAEINHRKVNHDKGDNSSSSSNNNNNNNNNNSSSNSSCGRGRGVFWFSIVVGIVAEAVVIVVVLRAYRNDIFRKRQMKHSTREAEPLNPDRRNSSKILSTKALSQSMIR